MFYYGYDFYDFRIDHKTQHKNMTADIIKESCTPCLLEEKRENWKIFLWSIASSEAFLLSLHILALALGVSKEALRIRDVSIQRLVLDIYTQKREFFPLPANKIMC